MANKLEAVLLLTTSREIDNGMFSKFLDQFNNINNSDLNFIICINNANHFLNIEPLISPLLKVFFNIEVYYLNLLNQDDFYYIDNSYSHIFHKPILGRCSGPNNLFFNSINICKKYDTILLLETDCKIKKEIFNISINYIKYCGDFLISGSKYDGNYSNSFFSDPFLFNHINGVAFYKTSSLELFILLNATKKYIIEECKSNNYVFLPYDYAMTKFILDNNLNIEIHKKIYKKMISNTFIVNLSAKTDSNISFDYVNKLFPNHLILHKKW
jgi:hypothetical protein